MDLERLRQHVEAERQFIRRHYMITFLRWWAENDGKADATFLHFLAKRLGQGRAEVEVEEIYTDCIRMKIIYRGKTHSWRYPKPCL